MVLLPKESGKLISSLSKHVTISEEGIKTASDLIIKAFLDGTISLKSYKSHSLHPTDAILTPTVGWIFVVDTLNFSFWSETSDKYKVLYHDTEYTGYWSLCAAVNRAVEEGYNLTSPAYYSTITLDTMQHIFRSTSGVEMPMLKERTEILNATGKILLETFNGDFLNCVEESRCSAQKLLKLIIDNFPSYRDEAVFDNQKVSFYKRAQILIGDIWCCLEAKGFGAFYDIDSISMFADYRLPQVLVYLGVMKYSDELQYALEKNELIENGHLYEVEIRGSTIWAVELMIQYMLEKRSQGAIPNDIMINAILIDHFLWDYRRENAEKIEHVPFHKTRCIYY